ncbi:MAG: dihydrofolate reductase family protein [Patulibacter sp.]
MRELVYYVALSLDGRIAGPDDDFSAFPIEGDHIELIARDYRDTLPGVWLERAGLTADRSRFDTVLMGWSTYAAGLSHGIDDPYPHLRQYVFSRRPRELPDGITQIVDDAVPTVRRLKAEDDSGIWLCGGGLLATALLPEIDRLILKINPVVLGDGPALFRGGDYDPRTFALEDSTRFRSGVVINEYVRRSTER